ncbi:hypothetical protein [Aureimonas altamirensis]|uniref:hypothetical protein n=1 Tax=Aureimonas altamirensis TaxID=370622 RepID=UPI003B9799CC
MTRIHWRAALAGAFALMASSTAALAVDTTPGPDSDKQFFPIASYRVGPYAASGASIWAGRIDYYRYINEVEGGINGVPIVWQECETEWTAEKGIECYERFKRGLNGAPSLRISPTARRRPTPCPTARRQTRSRSSRLPTAVRKPQTAVSSRISFR